MALFPASHRPTAHTRAQRRHFPATSLVPSSTRPQALIDNWHAVPSDTVFPYPNQILDSTNIWVVVGSCPAENTIFPSPRQNLPPTSVGTGTKSIAPGSTITFNFTDPVNQPHFNSGKDYYAVLNHGVANILVPFDTKMHSATIPAQFEASGTIIAVIADEKGAQTKETVLTGPLILLESPAILVSSLV